MSSPTTSDCDVAATLEEALLFEQEPLIIIEPLRIFLSSAGLGSGLLSAKPIGAGHSNVTYALVHGTERYVLRRPPRGPLPTSAHDMVREAHLLRALALARVRVPEVLATCETTDVIGAPFYVMRFIDGYVLDRDLPAKLIGENARTLIAEQLVDALIDLHAVDITQPALAAFGKSSGYLERQLKRFGDLLVHNATRPLPELEQVAAWLRDNRPASSESTIVHGDYRLGNVMFARQTTPGIVALLDWEMAALGDPLADVGYLTATWAESDDPPDPLLDLSAITRLPGFPSRTELIKRYTDRTGRDLSDLLWYQTLALWKAAIFLEGNYRRYLAGTTNDAYFARLEHGVPALARRAFTAITSP